MVRGAWAAAVVGMGLCLAACGEPVRTPAPVAAPPERTLPEETPPAEAPPPTDAPPPTPDAGPGETSTPPPLPQPPDAGVLEIPPDTGAQACVPEVTVAEAIPEPEGGWDAAARPLPSYQEPEDAAPFGLLEPLACVDDGRPPLDSWCERSVLNWDGTLLQRERRTATGTTTLDTHGCGTDPGCMRPHDAAQYDTQGRPLQVSYWDYYRDSHVYEAWQWAPDGRLSAFLEDSRHYDDHEFTLWRLRRACDGRPAHYEITHPGSTWNTATLLAPLTYDALGRLTHDFVPGRGTRRAWDAEGHLRAEEHVYIYSGSSLALRTYFDAAGQEAAHLRTYSGGHGSSDTWTWNERGPDGLVHATRTLWSYEPALASTLTRMAYDAQGRKVLAWATSTYEQPETRRRAYRWTYACSTAELVRYEEDRGGDGTADNVKTWTWDAEAQRITERENQYVPYTEYRYHCEP